jgi:hypothetical protein
MPKTHFSEAPAHVQQAMERSRRDMRLDTPSGTVAVAAIGVLHWMRAAYSRGYDVRPEDIPTPAMKQLEQFSVSDADLAALRVQLSLELEYERYCLREAHSRRAWAAAPDAQEQAEAARIARAEEAQQAAIEMRTLEILASDQAKRVETARAKARKEVESQS